MARTSMRPMVTLITRSVVASTDCACVFACGRGDGGSG
jgi:hypothetical protein